jgi:hypothetical protein
VIVDGVNVKVLLPTGTYRTNHRNQGNRHHKCRTQCLKGATAMTINRPAAS